jgi:hypothetical protein
MHGLRKRGGQPENENAVTHGRHSRRRRAERVVEATERRRKEQEWAAKVPQTDYGAICDALAAEKARPREACTNGDGAIGGSRSAIIDHQGREQLE